jgi:hypothetical protein
MIVLGLVLGRWWKTALAVGTVVWPSMLLQAGIIETGAGDLLGAALFGLANTAVGVGLHQAALHLVRRLRGPRPSAPPTSIA